VHCLPKILPDVHCLPRTASFRRRQETAFTWDWRMPPSPRHWKPRTSPCASLRVLERACRRAPLPAAHMLLVRPNLPAGIEYAKAPATRDRPLDPLRQP